MAKYPDSSNVSIGIPMNNVSAYVLDQNLQPVPIGVVGELHIGGLGLARGYLGRPEITAEKFIPHPFSHQSGAKLYKTCDLVRYLQDGNLEYIGRIDQQVKIRGFRIELGEIETVLTQHHEITEAVVVMHEDSPGSKRLIAYIVVVDILNYTEDLIHSIKVYLRKHIPEYMVPERLIILSTIPKTPSGKIDRRALPIPNLVEQPRKEQILLHGTEKLIAEVWQKILHIEKVSLNDNFFDLGGNSLLLVQVREQLQTIFTKKISIVEMFQHPTVRALGQLLSQQESPTPEAPKSEGERAELRNSSQGSMNQQKNIRQQYRSQKKQ